MSSTPALSLSEDEFLACVTTLCSLDASLSPLHAGVLLALHFEICRDSRTFARHFGIEHAIVLRAVTDLADDHGLLAIVDRNSRTQRTTLALTPASKNLLARASLAEGAERRCDL